MWRALLGLICLHGAAAACSPVPAAPEVVRASERLLAFQPREVPCRSPQPPRHWTVCEVYPARPAQVVPLLARAHSANVLREGSGWHLKARGKSGTDLRVTSSGPGTLVNFRRPIPVREKWHSDLHRALNEGLYHWQKNRWQRLFRQPNCQDLGLGDTAWYRIERCRFVARRPGDSRTLGREPYIEMALKTAADRTVPLHTPKRFGYTADSCQLYGFF